VDMRSEGGDAVRARLAVVSDFKAERVAPLRISIAQLSRHGALVYGSRPRATTTPIGSRNPAIVPILLR
jgi:hypothetical protein